MGHTIAPFRVRAKGRSKALEIDLLVDTGSTYTWIEGHLLRAGRAPNASMKVRND